MRVGEQGPLVASIIAEGAAPGIDTVVREVFLIEGLSRVDVRNVIDKQAVRGKEAVYFGFGFDIPDVVSRLDLGWGYIRPEQDQLPGSCKDFFPVQRWVDLSNSQGGITLATVEAPLVSLGKLVDERHHNEGPSGWKTASGSSSLVYSWVMNNYWHTNYKADQEGRCWFHYSVKPHGGFDPVEVYRFGVGRNQPLIVRRVAAGEQSVALPFALRSPAVTVTAITPTYDGRGFTVRLYNPTPEESSFELVPSSQAPIAVFTSSPRGEKGRAMLEPFALGPFEILTVRIE